MCFFIRGAFANTINLQLSYQKTDGSTAVMTRNYQFNVDNRGMVCMNMKDSITAESWYVKYTPVNVISIQIVRDPLQDASTPIYVDEVWIANMERFCE